MAWASGGLAVVAAGLGWVLGPLVVVIAFGGDFEPSRLTAAAVSFGVVFAGGGLFVGQILVARGEPVRLGIAWLSGLIAASAAVLLTPDLDPVSRVSVGFVAGEVIALVALVSGAVLSREEERPERGSRAAFTVAKRTIDIAVSLSMLVLTLPIVLVAGLAVRIDSPGPVFFRQIRAGKGGRAFGLMKIRTMKADADEEVFAEHLARLQATHMSGSAVPIGIPDDDRVTRVGRILRRSSIDELPNLWNVIRGHMSLVGPRPLVSDEAELIGLDNPRFTVKPGITGLAQVEGRDTITLSDRTRLDEEYVENRSGKLDASILLRTVGAVFTEPGD
jgi:lipopolysaccharide/colanic/teichoic acid biosynthesis glycosyltransferase